MRGAGLALLCLAAASCAVSCASPTALEQLRREVEGMPDLEPGAALAPVDADSAEAAWGRIVRARTEAPLEESRLLALAFDATASEPREIVVGGRYPKLTEQVLLDAFALARAERLPGLRLIHVSPEPPSDELVSACNDRGAVCTYRRWDEKPE